MGSTAQNGRGTSAVRLLGLLAVLLGLLAMHGLASSHHAAAAVPTAVTHAGADNPGSYGHGHVPVTGSATGQAADIHSTDHSPATVAALPAPDCDGDCRSDPAVLCLAVLVAASFVALLVAAARRRASWHLPARPQAARAPAPAHRHPRLGQGPLRQPDVSRRPGALDRAHARTARPHDPQTRSLPP